MSCRAWGPSAGQGQISAAEAAFFCCWVQGEPPMPWARKGTGHPTSDWHCAVGKNDFVNELGMQMKAGARAPGFLLWLCHHQQPWASLVSPCLSFPRQERLFTRREPGNRRVWQPAEPCG